ncbi:MAG TPA: hypothetical protein VGC66_01415 [Pyrinomonadaceae bacterium]|jgi:hypothetical protein
MSDTLLSYAISANQSPIQVSPQTGDPSIVTLMIVVSNSTHQLIDCQSISFDFLEGTNAKDFFPDSTGIGTAAPKGWNLTQSGSLFTATPATSEAGQIGSIGLTFVLSNIQVNEQVGTTDITITEVTTDNTGTLDYLLAKFPVEFTVGQLKANPISVNQGDSTTLSWNCSPGATYALQYLDVNEQVTITETTDGNLLPAVGSYTVENLQANPTIFYLIVTLTVAGQNQPLVFDNWFPVAVAIPNVQINSFTASTQTVDYPGDSVTFTWDVTAATQVQLNGANVEGNSATVPVNQTGIFVLQALGQGGPVTWSILVTVSPVKINSFTPTPSTVYGNNNNVPVTLAWDVQYASQLLLDNDIVTGQSVSVPVNQTSSFTLEATGYNGPVYAETGVTVAPVNVAISVVDNNISSGAANIISVSFNANPGAYTTLTFITFVLFGSTKPLFLSFSQQATTDSFGAIQLSQSLGQIPFLRILFVQVTLNGFPSGAIVTTYYPTS